MHRKNRDCYGCPGVINYLHTNFKLSNGETVALYDDAGLLIDSITIGIYMQAFNGAYS
ncbi:MAG: hypothetical protein IPL12_22665 [Bacteroidetes bacterium]|nr:hypothetical protein [Bacteroidota bacterium]